LFGQVGVKIFSFTHLAAATTVAAVRLSVIVAAPEQQALCDGLFE